MIRISHFLSNSEQNLLRTMFLGSQLSSGGASIAEDEPQLAYCAYTKGLCHRWKYFQRTVPNISSLFQPLENAIRELLIPKIFGREVSNQERDLFSLPLRFGGMGIQNPVDTADSEFMASSAITRNLTDLIMQQTTEVQWTGLTEQKWQR